MNRVRHGWIEKAFITAEAEALAAASDHYGGDVPREADALIAGASASAIDAVQGIAALGKLWGVRGDKRKASGLVRVLALHAVSTWLTSEDGVETTGDAGPLRLDWARDILRIFGMESDLNVDQFRLRDLQTHTEQAGRGDGLVSFYLLMSDMLRALGDQTRGPLVQAPSIPLSSYRDLTISDSFRQRISSNDIELLRQISQQNHDICRDAYHQTNGELSTLLSRLGPKAATDRDEADVDSEELVAGALEVETASEETSSPATDTNNASGAEVATPSLSPVVEAEEAVETEAEPPIAEEAPAEPEAAQEMAPEQAAELEETPSPAVPEEEASELDVSELEEDAPPQTYVFLDDGVGIVSIFDESVPEWRDLGLARGSLVGPAGQPLRITVNLSLQTAIASLDDELRQRLEALDEASLAQSAGTALVPLEFEYLRPLNCPRCGHEGGLNQVQQESLEEDYHPNPDGWPHGTPAGDRITLGCPQCDFLFEVVFWFWE